LLADVFQELAACLAQIVGDLERFPVVGTLRVLVVAS
jgi:hypothetical protein